MVEINEILDGGAGFPKRIGTARSQSLLPDGVDEPFCFAVGLRMVASGADLLNLKAAQWPVEITGRER